MMWFKLARRNLLRNRRRSLMTAGLIAIATFGLLTAYSYLQSTFFNVQESTIESGVGHLQLGKAEMFDDDGEYPLEFGLSPADQKKLREGTEGTEGVRSVLPRLQFEGLISNGEKSVFVSVQAGQVIEERRLSRGSNRVIRGSDFNPRGNDSLESVLIGEGLASSLNLHPGDFATLLAPTADGGLNAVDVSILGITKSGIPARDRLYLLGSLTFMQDFLATDRVDRIVVRLDDTKNTQRAAGEMSRLLPEQFEVRDWKTLTPFYGQLVTVYKTQFLVLGTILLAMSLVSALNALSMSVMERTREIGTLRALGLPARKIEQSFMWEGILLGSFGAVLGALIFSIMSIITVFAPIQMPPPPNRDVGYPLSFSIDPPAMLLLWFGFAICGALSAALVSRRISKISVREALIHV